MSSRRPAAEPFLAAAAWARADVGALHRALLARMAAEQEARRAYCTAARSQVAARVAQARARLLEAHDATARARAAETAARRAQG